MAANRARPRDSAPALTMRDENPPALPVHPFREAVQQWDGKPRTGPFRGAKMV